MNTVEFLTDFNEAEPFCSLTVPLIPANTLVKVSLHLCPGGYGPEGWLTKNAHSGTIYLNAEFTILEGPYAKQKVFQPIGLKGKKCNEQGEDTWGAMGRAMIRGLLESAHGIDPLDDSEKAKKARMIQSPGDLQGLICVVKIGIEKDEKGQYPDKNKVMQPITLEHKAYKKVMEGSTYESPAFAFEEVVNAFGNAVDDIPSWMGE